MHLPPTYLLSLHPLMPCLLLHLLTLSLRQPLCPLPLRPLLLRLLLLCSLPLCLLLHLLMLSLCLPLCPPLLRPLLLHLLRLRLLPLHPCSCPKPSNRSPCVTTNC